jgi:hypothetical protein
MVHTTLGMEITESKPLLTGQARGYQLPPHNILVTKEDFISDPAKATRQVSFHCP